MRTAGGREREEEGRRGGRPGEGKEQRRGGGEEGEGEGGGGEGRRGGGRVMMVHEIVTTKYRNKFITEFLKRNSRLYSMRKSHAFVHCTCIITLYSNLIGLGQINELLHHTCMYLRSPRAQSQMQR